MRATYANEIDDVLNEGNLDIAFDMYELLMKRRYERYRYALSLLDEEPDLNGNDQIEIDREKADWPKNETEANKLWEHRVKNDVINLKLKGKKWPEIQTRLVKRYNLAIQHLSKVKSDDIVQLYLNAFAREIDPHTSYRHLAQLKISMKT